ncbi:aldo-keto reductase family 1 member B1-like [Dreissena polymorpha]|uniref:NADP-dependent oxidoreductase domain-containing protein n=1 Tax=Dreissena polymorpha TaxID=45954 RepID=A0A9D4FZG9_DREPO|nr:aldo-keto reductase family 1 member B1-like [Dreissena polymorpha]KAH3806384.1 hypothetical protein DPMN_134705 [Dreissena polymorpha]
MTSSMLKPLMLKNGHTMPRLGVGTYLLSGGLCQEIVQRAVQLGYRHIDTAQAYENEQNVGAALHHVEKHNICQRKHLFVTTKLASVYMHPLAVKLSLEESLEKLKLRYVDMFLIHSPWGLKNHRNGNLRPCLPDGSLDFEVYDLNETWRAMEKLVTDGHVESIGLSNFSLKQTEQILATAKILPQNVQLECHAYYQQKVLRDFLSKYGTVVTAYSPLGSPTRPARHIVPENEFEILLEDNNVKEISKKYNVSSALVLVRFLLQQNLCAIPKTASFDRLKENIKVLDFELDSSDIQKMKSFDKNVRYFVFKPFLKHPCFPKAGEPF